MELYCNPYDTSKTGFSFDLADAGEVVDRAREAGFEEYSIELVDGNDDEAKAYGLWVKHSADLDVLADMADMTDYELVGLSYLLSCGCGLEDSLSGYQDVCVSEESAEDYAYEYAQTCLRLSGVALDYFDTDRFATDMLMSGDVAYHEGYLIINANAL